MKIYWHDGKKNIIGERVKELRKSSGLSQKQLAEYLQLNGYDFNDLTVLRIERGERFVADYELKALCEYFHVTADYLLGIE